MSELVCVLIIVKSPFMLAVVCSLLLDNVLLIHQGVYFHYLSAEGWSWKTGESESSNPSDTKCKEDCTLPKLQQCTATQPKRACDPQGWVSTTCWRNPVQHSRTSWQHPEQEGAKEADQILQRAQLCPDMDAVWHAAGVLPQQELSGMPQALDDQQPSQLLQLL